MFAAGSFAISHPVDLDHRSSMGHSVIRRSLFVTAAFVLGHLFHYALMITANRVLDPGTFGRFYSSISLLNVLLTPATVLTFTFAQHFSTTFSMGGIGSVASELRTLIRQHLPVAAALVLLCTLALLLVRSLIGADALLLLVLVPLVAVSVYFFEMVRAALQGMQNFVSYSLAWIAWRGGQYVLAVVALVALGTAWSGLAGIFAATVIATIVLLALIAYRAERYANMPKTGGWSPFNMMTAMPFMIEYGIFILINNIDVLIAYLLLGSEQLGAYAASSFLPKAIVTATQPVSQVMLPVINVAAREGRRRRPAFWKAFAVCGLVGAAGAAVLSFGGELACNERFGIRFCSPWLLAVLAFAAIPLGMLRILVVAGLAVGDQRHSVVPAIAVAAFVAVAFAWGRSPDELAMIYAVFCWAFMLLYGATMWSRRRLVRQASSAH
jgi:O-antigen/teichoic acid export membrane protein